MGAKGWRRRAIRGAALCGFTMAALALAAGQMSPPRLLSAHAAGASLGAGDVLKPEQYHLITNPGLYGLGPEPPDSRYVIAAGLLLRLHARSGKILSILREQREILD